MEGEKGREAVVMAVAVAETSAARRWWWRWNETGTPVKVERLETQYHHIDNTKSKSKYNPKMYKPIRVKLNDDTWLQLSDPS